MKREMSIMGKSKQTENAHASWVDESIREEIEEAEVAWELYCRERPFDHLSMAGWIVTDMEEER